MKVIVVYDINFLEGNYQNRMNKIRKLLRKYLNHVQKSVFEGEITEAKLYCLKKELEEFCANVDSVIIYKLPDTIKFDKELIGNKGDKTSNLL